MVETNDRKLPVGIQSFEEIRKGEYLYVDKTDIIWQLANRGKKYNYLSRPRRFGKSVLVDTLEVYFMGKKELFEGLKIMELETEWVKRPVIRLDMSQAGAEPKSVRIATCWPVLLQAVSMMFLNLTASEQSGRTTIPYSVSKVWKASSK